MNEHEEIAKALKARLSELRTHLAKVDRSLRKPLSADSEDQAIELENQEALEVIENPADPPALQKSEDSSSWKSSLCHCDAFRVRFGLWNCSAHGRRRKRAANKRPNAG
jgi:hypothetical protein